MDQPQDITGTGLFFRGPLGIHVALRLHGGRLQVEPTSRLERLAGARPFSIDLAAVQDVHGSWLRGMTIETASGPLRFSGAGIKVVYEALKLQLGRPGDPRRLLPGESVLVEGAVELVASPVWISGTLRITSRRLLFLADTGVQSVLGTDRSLELPIEWVGAAQLDADGQLQLAVDGGPGRSRPPVRFAQGIAVRAGALLLAMGIDEAAAARPLAERPPPVPPAIFGPVELLGGPVRRQGFAAIGPGGIGIAADDLVASVAGPELTLLDHAGLLGWTVPQDAPATLHLHHRRGDHSLAFADVALALDRLAELAAGHAPEGARLLDGQHRLSLEDVDELMAAVPGVLPQAAAQQGIAGVAVIHGPALGRARRGWLLLLTAGFLLVDIDETRATFLPGPFIDRARVQLDEAGRIDMRVDRKPVGVLVVGGEAPARAIWSAFGGRAPEKSEVFAAFPHVADMLGRVSCLRVARDRRELFSRRMATTHLEPEGLTFKLPLPVHRRLEPGARVEVELGDERTVYTFRTDVARIDLPRGEPRAKAPAPPAGGAAPLRPAPVEHALVVLLLARQVERRDNRRRQPIS